MKLDRVFVNFICYYSVHLLLGYRSQFSPRSLLSFCSHLYFVSVLTQILTYNVIGCIQVTHPVFRSGFKRPSVFFLQNSQNVKYRWYYVIVRFKGFLQINKNHESGLFLRGTLAVFTHCITCQWCRRSDKYVLGVPTNNSTKNTI